MFEKYIEIFLPNGKREIKKYVPGIQLPKEAYAYRYFIREKCPNIDEAYLYGEVTSITYLTGTRLYIADILVEYPNNVDLILDMFAYNYEWAIKLPDGTIVPLRKGDRLIHED